MTHDPALIERVADAIDVSVDYAETKFTYEALAVLNLLAAEGRLGAADPTIHVDASGAVSVEWGDQPRGPVVVAPEIVEEYATTSTQRNRYRAHLEYLAGAWAGTKDADGICAVLAGEDA